MNHQEQVAYLGPRGTFSQAAVVSHFGSGCVLHECSSIDDVFVVVENNNVNYGVVPIENSTEGSVNNTQDCLIDSSVNVVGEVIVPIIHCMLTNSEASEDNIDKIASHKQSLAQCRNWIKKNYPRAELIECSSNAQAATLAIDNSNVAAIAGTLAAKEYQLKIQRRTIQDQKHNSTRFLILANQQTESSGNDKTSILVYTQNKPGALFRILQPFENLRISLTRIETRPAKIEAWAYVFFIDFEGHVQDETVIELFDRLKSCVAEIKVLGSYPAFGKIEQ